MTFPTDDILLGPRSFGRLHRLDMLIGHTGEEPGFSRDYAVKTTIWQRTNPGSYSFRIYDSTSAGSKGGLLLTVPYLEASGGINPSSDFWAPERYPFLERELARAGPCPHAGCPGPYRNPTMHAGQISYTGRTADLATRAPANYVPDGERLIAWYDQLSIRGSAPLVLVMHGHWQRNRSDWGAWMHAQLTEEDEMQFWKPVQEDWWTVAKTATALGTVFYDGAGVQKEFTSRERLRSTDESSDGRYRLVRYGATERLVVDARGNDREGPGLIAIPGTRIPATGYGFPPPPPSAADLEERIEDQAETITRLTGRIRLKDEHHAEYPKG